MSMKGTCCCCFINHARSLILLLSFFVITSLFANTLLLNFAIIHKDDLVPKHFIPLSSEASALTATEPSRIRRAADFNVTDYDPTEGEPIPMEDKDEFSTEALISEIQKDSKREKKKPETDVDEGYPIPSMDSSIETAYEAATYPSTTRNTRRILLTKATSSLQNVKNENSELEKAAPLIATTLPPKSISKGFSIQDKDTVSAIKESESKTEAEKIRDFSGVSFIADRPLWDDVFDFLFFAAPGLGMLLSHIISSIIISKLGSHKLLFIALGLSSLTTFAVPYLLQYGQNAIIITRVIQGFAFGPIFSFIGKNNVAWASLKEQMWFICTQISALIVTPLISWSLTNLIISEENFNVIFYLHAGFTLFLAIVWLIFYRDIPQKHRWVNGLELNKVMTGKAQNNRIMEHNVFSTVFKSIPVAAIWVAAFGYFCAFALFATFLPVYAHTVTHLVPYQAGIFAIIPFALMAFVHWVSYLCNKWINLCGLTLKVRLYNTAAFVVCAILFIGLAISAALHGYNEYSTFVNFVHFAALCSLGFAINGFFQSAVVVGRYYSQYLISHMMLPFSLAFIFVPAITVFCTPLNLLRYWRFVFLAIAAVLLLSAVVFACFGRGQPTVWAETSWDPIASSKMLTHMPMNRSDDECGIIQMRTIDDYFQSSSDQCLS